MGLTGALGAASPAACAAERVELLALLSQMLDGDAAYCANPRLLMVAGLVPELRAAPAFALVRDRRATANLDTLVKTVVTSAYAAEPDDLGAALDTLSQEWDAMLGMLAGPVAAAYRDVRTRADPLGQGLDPGADIAAITGEVDPLALVVQPSLFLPPPQTGRHSVLVETDRGSIAHLHYGYPLDDSPARFGITRYWLMGGAWHYVVQRFLKRHWPSIATDLRASTLEAPLTRALAGHRDSPLWPQVIGEHVDLAIKCLLCDAVAMPDTAHQGFAYTQGLAFFPWFRRWARALAGNPAGFVDALHRLPQAMARAQPDLVATATTAVSGPPSIAFALASNRRPVVVLPNAWDDDLVDRIRRRWSLVTAVFLRHAVWVADARLAGTPIVAFGQVGHDPLIDGLMEHHALKLERTADGDDVLMALLPPDPDGRPWSIAIALHDPNVAADFAAEQAVKLFHRIVRFSGMTPVEGDGVALSI